MNEDWLKKNRSLRMDANLSIFPEIRREFHLDRYRFATQYSTDKVVLDAACGTGYGSQLLGTNAKQVIGVDIDSETIEYAKSKYKSNNVDFQLGCAEWTELGYGSIDLVVSFETVEHTLCPVSHMKEITRVLNSEGTAILSVPNSWGLTNHHFWDFNLKMLQNILMDRFNSIEYYYNNSTPIKGRPQGIGPLDDSNTQSAECIIAVATQPIKDENFSHIDVMNEIYTSVFKRHAEYIRLKR